MSLVNALLIVICALMYAECRTDYEHGQHVMERSEQETLYQVMEAVLDDPQWQRNHPNPCSFNSWPGLECQQLDDYILHVTKLEFGSSPKSRCKQNVTLPQSIFKLVHLKALVLISCFTSSETLFPSGFQKLAQSLEVLTLRGNSALSGAIPRELGTLKKLEVLSLSQNSLHGSVPAELGSLQKLQSLDLSYNSLSGGIPREMGFAGSLSILDLSNNQLTGRIPDSLANLRQLKKLDLSNNRLQGPIPRSVGSLSSLQFLALDRNNLTGGLPLEMERLTNLQSLLVQDNPMHAYVPDFWRSLSKVTELRLSNSGYIGTIPASLASLRNLSELVMDRNSLTGLIPPSLESLPNLYHLNLSNNLLLGSVPFSTNFCVKLGQNLDLHGNTGLCIVKSMSVSTSDLPRCNGKNGHRSAGLLHRLSRIHILSVIFYVIISTF